MNQSSLHHAIASVVTIFLAGQAALAQGTANSPSTQHVVDVTNSIVWIGGPNDTINGPLPIPIDLDANGGPWRKQIYSNSTSPFFGGSPVFRETILNAGTEPWTDWHEINLNLGQIGANWGSGNAATEVRVDGTSISFTASVSGQTLNLDNFSQPVLPGQVLEIEKHFEITTDNVVGPNTLLFTLAEFPTTTIPEPATLILLVGWCLTSPRFLR
ncbi:hypothetical protein [Bythopirellula goksoeyrii]|uniref:PEP-CTERM protein-sorting domain-containing protein n=1 Tax=Bythopirellula goksoeyrii TaxID=1400387 RepID=A0A5B9QDL0_9BACT|nr:hypothetical protein [Bythopirellula goksoeyrii]QEG35720.1 hypothetical protein Pr1d_30230 [Bythopirellula goksoeyrii]